MALDEPKDDDEIVKNNGVTFLVNKQLLDQVKPIVVDFVTPDGFRIFNIFQP